MRKINKGPAIAGGILCFAAIIAIAIDFIQMLSYDYPAEIIIRNGIIQGLNILALLLLAVVLFRGKADIFGGIVCSLNIALALYAVFTNSRSVLMYLRHDGTNFRLVVFALYVLANLLKAAAFLTMALQCFKKKPGKNALCLVLALIGTLAFILAATYNVLMLLGGGSLDGLYLAFSRRAALMLRHFARTFVPGVFESLFLIFAGAAFTKVRIADAPAAPYGQYPPYQAPQYQPQYQYPQYQQPQYQAPQYQQPQYQYPQYQQPQYQAPQYQQPQYQAPQYQQPQYQAPQYQPQYQYPQYQQPQYQAPQEVPQEVSQQEVAQDAVSMDL